MFSGRHWTAGLVRILALDVILDCQGGKAHKSGVVRSTIGIYKYGRVLGSSGRWFEEMV